MIRFNWKFRPNCSSLNPLKLLCDKSRYFKLDILPENSVITENYSAAQCGTRLKWMRHSYQKMRQKTMEFYCKKDPFLRHRQDIWKQLIAFYQCYCDFWFFNYVLSLANQKSGMASNGHQIENDPKINCFEISSFKRKTAKITNSIETKIEIF